MDKIKIILIIYKKKRNNQKLNSNNIKNYLF